MPWFSLKKKYLDLAIELTVRWAIRREKAQTYDLLRYPL